MAEFFMVKIEILINKYWFILWMLSKWEYEKSYLSKLNK
jgi:hypothetical protein